MKTFRDVLVFPRPSISRGGEFMLVYTTRKLVMTKPSNIERGNKLVCKREMGQCEANDLDVNIGQDFRG